MITRNNPGNIRYNSSISWRGQVGQLNGFVEFDTLKSGFLAMCKLLSNAYVAKGHNTIARIITRWAPPSENDTSGYIDYVAKRAGVDRNTILTPKTLILVRIAYCMTEMEHGREATKTLIPVLSSTTVEEVF